MNINPLRVRFYQTEPSFATAESAIRHYHTTVRSQHAEEVTEQIGGATVIGVVATHTSMCIYFENMLCLEIRLSKEAVEFLVNPTEMLMKGVTLALDMRTPCSFQTSDSYYHFEWDPVSILQKLIASKVHIFGAFNSSIYLDIGNATALHISRMFVEEYGSDILFYQYG